MNRLLEMKTACIAIFMALTPMAMASADDPVFMGSSEFNAAEAKLQIKLDQARNALDAYLEESRESYYAFPEEVIMIHEGGFLFIQGDFHRNIHFVGYHVSADGAVTKLDLKESISIKDYMKLIGRSSWGSWL
ncbi:MAG: hypothetical protein R3242_07655 [Akkermansiaceae bacterium]|nr:hypothetical protein [Akkermansiaceae bacterium]